ncbi:MAG: T9SS type A sorting domain-containing protein [Chloroflexota bacterium]
MQKLLFPISLLMLVLSEVKVTAQPPLPVPGVEYTYDLNGNRIKRRCTDVYMKRGLPNDSTEVEAALGADNKITVAPNPTTGILKIEITGKLLEDSPNAITLVDMKGAPLFEMKIKQSSMTLDIGSYVNGHYFMLVNLNGRQQLFKIIKEN